MKKLLDLDRCFAITSADKVSHIVKPLVRTFDIKHFRYLKLYQDGSRILLSNYPDCTRFMYETGLYQQMWFDGNFPEYLTEGWHLWNVLQAKVSPPYYEKSLLEKEINQLLGLYDGVTLVMSGANYHEVYTFDAPSPAVYGIDETLLLRFIYYFKDQARKLLEHAEHEKIHLPIKPFSEKSAASVDQIKINNFLNSTHVRRCYLGGKYGNEYLTTKELQCLHWLIQGKSAEEIALIESSGTKTVHKHFESLRRKLNCYKQTQLVRIAIESGLSIS